MRENRVAVRAEDRTDNATEPCGNETQGRSKSLWDRMLALLEEDLAERRERKIFLRVPGGTGSFAEIGGLSTEQLRSLDSGLHGWVAEQLLDRYLAERGYVDLLGKRHAYTKKIEDLVPEDLPALVIADRVKAEEQMEERERARFASDVHRDLGRLGAMECTAVGQKLPA
jgi:hypothetical protein